MYREVADKTNSQAFDLAVGFLYFSVSNSSCFLQQLIGLPREVMYGLFLIMLFLFF